MNSGDVARRLSRAEWPRKWRAPAKFARSLSLTLLLRYLICVTHDLRGRHRWRRRLDILSGAWRRQTDARGATNWPPRISQARLPLTRSLRMARGAIAISGRYCQLFDRIASRRVESIAEAASNP